MNTTQNTPSIFLQQAGLLKQLAHPARLAILKILEKDGESCVCHLEAKLGFRQAYISQQLATLRKSGLIEDNKDGWNVYYHIKDLSILPILDAVKKAIGQDESIEKISLDSETICPCPKCNQIG